MQFVASRDKRLYPTIAQHSNVRTFWCEHCEALGGHLDPETGIILGYVKPAHELPDSPTSSTSAMSLDGSSYAGSVARMNAAAASLPPGEPMETGWD